MVHPAQGNTPLAVTLRGVYFAVTCEFRVQIRAILTNMRTKSKGFTALLLAVAFLPAGWAEADDARMNQFQAIGSHNSYKEAIDPSLWKLLREEMGDRILGLEYSHLPLSEQLTRGLRKLELDVVHDPVGGRFAKPYGIELVKEAGLPPGPAYDPDGLMAKPGLKVLHSQDVDFRTNVYTFRQALEELLAWSHENPRHLPIAVTMNAKSGGIDKPGFTDTLPWDSAAFDAWDAEIRAVLPASKLITPDDVRGEYPSLEAAVLAHAWPTIGEARGRLLFVLDQSDEKMETYVAGHPSLKGRVMFVNATEGRAEAAFRIVNDPVKQFDYIQHLVRSGYIVRTRADANTREARTGDYSRMEKAFASGAQYVSTDYYVPNPDFGTGFQVKLPGGGPGRWNPLLLPAERPLPAIE